MEYSGEPPGRRGDDTGGTMQPSIREILEKLTESGGELVEAMESGAHERALIRCKEVMGLASRLHARLVIVIEFDADARYVAEVDRALQREKQPRSLPIPGDQPLPLSPNSSSPPPKRGKRGK